ncbi:MAG: alanine racemase [Ignavibacteriae bacterium]|nr:alanine racemase [Ignavibacteriota bacterium]NOG97943.1 alanine racemase [Ignavibacteriota bacterium]
MFETSIIELSKSNFKSNIKYIQDLIGENVLLAPVIKGNAYGHGIEQFVLMAQTCCKIKIFCVYSACEALRVFKTAKAKTRIIIMGWLDNDEVEWAIKNNIEYYVFDIDRLRTSIEKSKKVKKPALIHLELETGMNRTGFENKELMEAIDILKSRNARHLKLKGICTHYAGAESIANYFRVRKQYNNFKKLTSMLSNNGVIAGSYHSSSSAATITYPKMRMDMVRVGILMYGFWPSQETFVGHSTKQKLHEDPLKRVISWKTKVMSVKSVKKGEFIGYGTHYFAERNTDIAILPVGYGHGYSRSLSNSGVVLIHGRRAAVAGIVNMNLTIVDITDIPNVKKGDEVVLIGEQKNNCISVSSFTAMSDQLNYELLTRLPIDIPRQIVD